VGVIEPLNGLLSPPKATVLALALFGYYPASILIDSVRRSAINDGDKHQHTAEG
jgi:hypothetical protein